MIVRKRTISDEESPMNMNFTEKELERLEDTCMQPKARKTSMITVMPRGGMSEPEIRQEVVTLIEKTKSKGKIKWIDSITKQLAGESPRQMIADGGYIEILPNGEVKVVKVGQTQATGNGTKTLDLKNLSQDAKKTGSTVVDERVRMQAENPFDEEDDYYPLGEELKEKLMIEEEKEKEKKREARRRKKQRTKERNAQLMTLHAGFVKQRM